MNKTMTDLLPCPFCGSNNIKSYQTDMGVGMQTSTVSCKSCKAEMSLCSLNAISAWNTRTQPQTVDVDGIAAEHERVKKERNELAQAIIKIHEDQEGDYDFLKFISHPQYILAKKVRNENGKS